MVANLYISSFKYYEKNCILSIACFLWGIDD